MKPLSREEFINYFDIYPVFRFMPKNKSNMLRYQYSSKDPHEFDVVNDLITYVGEDKEGFHYWISNDKL